MLPRLGKAPHTRVIPLKYLLSRSIQLVVYHRMNAVIIADISKIDIGYRIVFLSFEVRIILLHLSQNDSKRYLASCLVSLRSSVRNTPLKSPASSSADLACTVVFHINFIEYFTNPICSQFKSI